MHQEIFIVDAFTDRPFRGNPAGVCVCETPFEESTMQSIAMEMNHAETAFLHRNSPGNYNLRWFTPSQEVPLCGHATLASAHILWETGRESGNLIFATASGDLTAFRESNRICMDFPTEFSSEHRDRRQFEAALGVKVLHVAKNRMFWLAEVPNEEAVRGLSPEMEKIASLGLEGVIVTARSDSESDDFVSRLFAPNVGIPEDPVTGSAHCVLAPYWAAKLDKTDLVGYQASKRGGVVGVEFLGARVLLKGQAVTTFRGQLQLGASVQ